MLRDETQWNSSHISYILHGDDLTPAGRSSLHRVCNVTTWVTDGRHSTVLKEHWRNNGIAAGILRVLQSVGVVPDLFLCLQQQLSTSSILPFNTWNASHWGYRTHRCALLRHRNRCAPLQHCYMLPSAIPHNARERSGGNSVLMSL